MKTNEIKEPNKIHKTFKVGKNPNPKFFNYTI